jgi:hypothetical protein
MIEKLLSIAMIALGAVLVSAPVLAGTPPALPEPVSMSLVAGGIGAIAVVRYLRRK